jgi:hypothetical protein
MAGVVGATTGIFAASQTERERAAAEARAEIERLKTQAVEMVEAEIVEIAGISNTSRSPSRIIDPLPNLFSMFASAASTARPRSAFIRSSAITYISFFRSSSQESD